MFINNSLFKTLPGDTISRELKDIIDGVSEMYYRGKQYTLGFNSNTKITGKFELSERDTQYLINTILRFLELTEHYELLHLTNCHPVINEILKVRKEYQQLSSSLEKDAKFTLSALGFILLVCNCALDARDDFGVSDETIINNLYVMAKVSAPEIQDFANLRVSINQLTGLDIEGYLVVPKELNIEGVKTDDDITYYDDKPLYETVLEILKNEDEFIASISIEALFS